MLVRECYMIPIKNYIKIAVLFIVVILVSFMAANVYTRNKAHIRTIPILRGHVYEISTVAELGDYIVENDNAIIYVGAASDDNCRKIEEELINLLKKKGLIKDVVYLNVSQFEDMDGFYSEFNEKYGSKMNLTAYPAFIVFKDGKVLDMVSKSNNQDLQLSDIDLLIDQQELAK